MKGSGFQRKERGVVLVISLIVLLVVTLVGIAGMSSSVLQERMASNAQNANRAFQGAESSVALFLELLDDGKNQVLLEQLINLGVDETWDDVVVIDAENDVEVEYKARYLGEVILTSGSSMDANESSTLLEGHRFEVISLGNVAGNARSRVLQGIEYY